MVALICLFFPAIVSVWIFEALSKEDLTGKKWGYQFVLNCLLINFACILVLRFLFGNASSYVLNGDMHLQHAYNYLILAIPAAVVLSVMEVLLKKNVKITVEDKNDENP